MKNSKRILIIFYLFFITTMLFAQETRPDNWAKRVNNFAFKNLYRLNDSIYRSEQPDEKGFKVIDSLKIKSVLSLRSSYKDAKLTGKSIFNLYQVGMAADSFTDEEIIKALQIIRNSPKPLLIHCVHGADRTGVVVAMYRILFNGFTKEQAIDEMKNGDYNFHKVYQNIPDYIKKADIEYIKNKVNKK
jgi:protein tyrosine/serine phosphatase